MVSLLETFGFAVSMPVASALGVTLAYKLYKNVDKYREFKRKENVLRHKEFTLLNYVPAPVVGPSDYSSIFRIGLVQCLDSFNSITFKLKSIGVKWFPGDNDLGNQILLYSNAGIIPDYSSLPESIQEQIPTIRIRNGFAPNPNHSLDIVWALLTKMKLHNLDCDTLNNVKYIVVISTEKMKLAYRSWLSDPLYTVLYSDKFTPNIRDNHEHVYYSILFFNNNSKLIDNLIAFEKEFRDHVIQNTPVDKHRFDPDGVYHLFGRQ